METGHPSTRAVNSGRQLGPSTRVVETGLNPNPKTMSLAGCPKVIPYTKLEQTNKHKQTDSNILPTRRG